MAHELTWQHQYGSAGEGVRLNETTNVVSIRAKQLWTLARFLTGADGKALLGAWTLHGSGDGSTGAMDGVDRWALTGSFDANKIKYVSTSAWSWMTFRAPTTLHASLYLTLYCTSTANQIGSLVTFADPNPNAGAVWTSRASPGTPLMYGVCREGLNANIVGNAVAYSSGDGGKTWTPRTFTYVGNTCDRRGSVVLAGCDNKIARSTDGGVTFAQVGGATSYIQRIRFKPGSSTHALAVGNNNSGYRTTDGGATWTPFTFPGSAAHYLDLAWDGANVVAVSSVAACCVSSDDGATWTNHVMPGVTGRVCRNGANVLAGGTTYQRSTDGGATWTTLAGPGFAGSAMSNNGDKVSVLGASNSAATSTDLGQTWTTRTGGSWSASPPGEMGRSGDEIVVAQYGAANGGVWTSSSDFDSALPGDQLYIPFTACHATTLHPLTFHGWLSTRGDVYATFGRVNDNRPALGFALVKLQDAQAGDARPILLAASGDSSQGTISYAYEGFGGAGGSYNTGILNVAAGRCWVQGMGSQYAACALPMVGANSANIPALPDVVVSPAPALPVPVVTSSGTTSLSNQTWRGRLPDAKAGRSGALDLAPLAGAVEWINVGALWLPWPNGVTPSI